MNRIVVGILCAILVSACTPMPKKPDTIVSQRIDSYVEFEVNLRPNDNGTITLPGNRGCINGNGNKDGCVRFGPGDYGVIVFNVGPPGQANGECGDPGTRWVITEILVTDTGDQDTGKGSNFGTPVADWLEEALYPFEEESTGTLYKKTWAGNLKPGDARVGVLNLNNNDSNDPREFWYQVTAKKCSDATTAVTDPRVENNGR